MSDAASNNQDGKNYRVFTVTERGEGKDPIWTRVGTMLKNKGDSYTLLLNATPMNSRLVILPPKKNSQQ